MAGPSLLLRLLLAAVVAHALPLNINLGTYSPALVAGDGAEGIGLERAIEVAVVGAAAVPTAVEAPAKAVVLEAAAIPDSLSESVSQPSFTSLN